MIYDIRLRIAYEYQAPADVGRHILRIAPREIPGVQRVLHAALKLDPAPSEKIHRTDFFGNDCTEVAYGAALSETRFEMSARVERIAQDLGLDVSPDRSRFEAELAATPSIAADAPQNYLFSSVRVGTHRAVADWAAKVARRAETALTTAEAISDALHERMTFDSTATMVDTPLEEAFHLKRGVCQDYTHIAICALRSLGIPAGYVSGFLRTLPPEGQERLEGADAMHAWVRAWCGKDMGWVEFDPTNAMRAGQDHVVIAYGRDYFDVAPVKGALRIAGGQSNSQAVDVVALD
ncbi:transglutaminase family protein [Pseudooceanicola sp. CBS1P-1]|uniref:Transglutaminase family protein n=1 Tax=Pseudooceanicola albus TaxID=2692189 RepID=A0A6L7G3H5_9RHOB|nr:MULTISPECIES: transglutaminase family protein [Pseudooceanicola]MBT9384958.1 transglutaminase family protein [Pseudooceanicola endophyticus]MXN18047.1 transglutaminase family protein [Pseudooceanicola albus]